MVIENQGHAPVTDEFWVESYIDPAPVPTAVNQIWWELGTEGMIWGVDAYEADTDYGTVLESHEISGGAYNNIGGTDSAE